MRNKIGSIFLFFILLLSTCITIQASNDNSINVITEENNNESVTTTSSETPSITCLCFGLGRYDNTRTTIISEEQAQTLQNLLTTIAHTMTYDPNSPQLKQLQHQLITTAKDLQLIPQTTSTILFRAPKHPIKTKNPTTQPITHASEHLCNYLSFGTGSALPVIVLPRLIPILLTPIPRVYFKWNAADGYTTCGGIRSGTGFQAYGQQTGTALGFWGIGFSIFLPPVRMYAILGYALHASVDAEEIHLYPPNYPPTIINTNPPDGAQNIPIHTKELCFDVADKNNELLNITITTTPNVGSLTVEQVPPGTYSMPVYPLEGTQDYHWTIHITDAEHTVENTYSFTTEPVAPTITQPQPIDGERYISTNLTTLTFYLNDPQHDLMNYTLETSPPIGTGTGTKVPTGTYSTTIANLEPMTTYHWYVNATDGSHTKHAHFRFQTEPQMIFDPFVNGWPYRKNITIDHTKVAGNLTNFPVLITITDTDLQNKAQPDGDDILFMDNIGIATRQYHEIEYYNSSTGELIAWVNTTHLNAKTNTTIILYYGNSNCSTQQFSDKTWDDNYLSVYHMNEQDKKLKDSTKYNNTGIEHGRIIFQDSGKIGYHIICDENGDFFDLGDELGDIQDSITCEGWIKPLDKAGNLRCDFGVIGNWKNHKGFMLHGGAKGTLRYFQGFIDNTYITVNYDSYNTWYYVVFTWDKQSGDLHLFLDGKLVGSKKTNYLSNPNNNAFIGIYGNDPPRWFNGGLDELRISSIARNSSWIVTQYHNQICPTTFYLIGQEETILK